MLTLTITDNTIKKNYAIIHNAIWKHVTLKYFKQHDNVNLRQACQAM